MFRLILLLILCITSTTTGAQTEAYNSVRNNLLENYWDEKATTETGPWKCDYQGDSYMQAIDSVMYMALESRLPRTRGRLLEVVNKTLEYGSENLDKYWEDPTKVGEFELYAALGGAAGGAIACEWFADYKYKYYNPKKRLFLFMRHRYQEQSRLYGRVIARDWNALMSIGLPLDDKALAATAAWSLLRMAGSTTFPLSIYVDTTVANKFVTRVRNHSDIYSYSAAEVNMYLQMYEVTADENHLDKAVEIGSYYDQVPIDPTSHMSLSSVLDTMDVFLSLYEHTNSIDYFIAAQEWMNFIIEHFLIDDPYNPGFKLLAHDISVVTTVRSGQWEYQEDDPVHVWTRCPACTGCNHRFLNLVHKYNELLWR